MILQLRPCAADVHLLLTQLAEVRDLPQRVELLQLLRCWLLPGIAAPGEDDEEEGATAAAAAAAVGAAAARRFDRQGPAAPAAAPAAAQGLVTRRADAKEAADGGGGSSGAGADVAAMAVAAIEARGGVLLFLAQLSRPLPPLHAAAVLTLSAYVHASAALAATGDGGSGGGAAVAELEGRLELMQAHTLPFPTVAPSPPLASAASPHTLSLSTQEMLDLVPLSTEMLGALQQLCMLPGGAASIPPPASAASDAPSCPEPRHGAMLGSHRTARLLLQLLSAAESEVQALALSRLLSLVRCPESGVHNSAVLLGNELCCHQLLAIAVPPPPAVPRPAAAVEVAAHVQPLCNHGSVHVSLALDLVGGAAPTATGSPAGRRSTEGGLLRAGPALDGDAAPMVTPRAAASGATRESRSGDATRGPGTNTGRAGTSEAARLRGVGLQLLGWLAGRALHTTDGREYILEVWV